MADEKKANHIDKEKDNEQELEQVEEKWVKYYSSLHEILLVGEGDFSFSTCLAQSFGSASNIVASSLDSYADVIKKYKNGESNLSILDKLGALHLHEVDARKMKFHSNLSMRKFDRIIFNFPHAGFYGKEHNSLLIGMHKRVLGGFFQNASGMLRPNGEVHVNHKTAIPYCHWNLEELASNNTLRLIERVAFKKEDYPGYENKRGAGSKCDQQFLLGECCTFKFSFSPDAKVTKVKQNMKRPQKPAEPPKFVPWQPNSFGFRHPPSDFVTYINGSPASNKNLGSSLELLQTHVRASQQGNILEHGQPRELLQAPTCAYQQGNYLAYRHSPSDLVTFVTDTPALNIPYGRSQLLQTPRCASQQVNILEHVVPRELLQTLIRASQQGNILEHGLPHDLLQTLIRASHQGNSVQHVLPRELLQTLIRSSQQGNVLVHGQPRELLPAPICANQQRNYLASRHPASDLNLQMRGIPGCHGPPHIDNILLKCKSIFGGYFEQVVKALGSPDHNPSYFLKEALQLGYTRYIDGDPRGTRSNYAYIVEQLRKFVAGGQACQVSRQVTVENNLASNSRIGPFM